MEDAHISETLPDKNSVFGVFDGHGGKGVPMQGQKYQHSWNGTLSRSSKRMAATSGKTMRRLSRKPSSRWTNCCCPRAAKEKS